MNFNGVKNARQRKVPVYQDEVFHIKCGYRHLMGDRQGREQEIMPNLIPLLLRARDIEMAKRTDGRHFGIKVSSLGRKFSELEVHGKNVIDPILESHCFLWIVFQGQMGTSPQLCYSGKRDGE
ncbi:hypothetical protein BCY90_04915 [Agrobacterium deltaense]|nr:hypothetical protein L901_03065 [Agrobacterium sp. D14]RKF38062.1 hypothetical protein BCY90_04915 [Agrobacterium deltaense]